MARSTTLPYAARHVTVDLALRPRSRPGSGRGLLLVTLGEMVWRKQETVWASSLVAALGELGVSENAARKALHRSVASGVLEVRREGREARCLLTTAGKKLLREGSGRVFGFRAESPDWDGRWLVVTVTVPETQRSMRHYLKTRFTWAGLGSPTPGVWITPHVHTPVEAILGRPQPSVEVCSYVGPFGPVGRESAMVKSAWDIAGLEALYREFIASFDGKRPRAGRDVFCAYLNLLQAWRPFPYIDPQLPRQFLPSPWIGKKASELLRQQRESWSAAAMDFWNELQGTSRR